MLRNAKPCADSWQNNKIIREQQMKQGPNIQPVQLQTSACPLCGEEAKYPLVNRSLYEVKERDVDLYPRQITWSESVSRILEPRFLHFWQCPHCQYTADHNFFQNPLAETQLSLDCFRRSLLSALSESDSYELLKKLLAANQDSEPSAFKQALKLNLHAIYLMEQIPEMYQQECLPLASYYLRLAWFFRDMRYSPGCREKFQSPIHELFQALRPYFRDLQLCEDHLLSCSFEYYRQGLLTSTSVTNLIKEIQIQLVMARIQLQRRLFDQVDLILRQAKRRVRSFEHILRKKEKEGRLDHAPLFQGMRAIEKSQNMIDQVNHIFDMLLAHHLDAAEDPQVNSLASLTESILICPSVEKAGEEANPEKSGQEKARAIAVEKRIFRPFRAS